MSELQLIDSCTDIYPVTGSDVGPMVEKSLVSIKEMNKSFKVWNRSHSDVAWNALVLAEHSETRNLRQVAAEIKKKRDALVEVHFKYKKNLKQAEVFDHKASLMEDGPEKELMILEANEQRAFAQMKHEGIVGATKDVEALRASYDKILKRIIDKHGSFDEEIFEREEKTYWIRRAFYQAIQDVRDIGRISKGEQMLMDKIGVDPDEALNDINKFLVKIRGLVARDVSVPSELKEQFLSDMETKYAPNVVKRLELMGETTDHLLKD